MGGLKCFRDSLMNDESAGTLPHSALPRIRTPTGRPLAQLTDTLGWWQDVPLWADDVQLHEEGVCWEKGKPDLRYQAEVHNDHSGGEARTRLRLLTPPPLGPHRALSRDGLLVL